MSNDHDSRDALLDALLDGELGEQQVNELAQENAADWRSARELARLMAQLSDEAPPQSLEQKLLTVPEFDSKPGGTWQRWLETCRSWFSLPAPAWRFAVAAIPLLAVGLWLAPTGSEPGRAEIEQGRRDLAVAMAYLQKTHSRAGELIGR